jgi:hypothetical protein
MLEKAAIIPILFYHGGNGSLVIKSFAEHFDQNIIEKYDFNKYFPDFETVFYDFYNDSNLKVLGERRVRLTLKFFKISKIKDITVIYQEIISSVIIENGVDRGIFHLGVNYIADSREEFNYYILNERLKYKGMKKEADIVISAADKLRTKEAKRILLKQIKFKFGNLDPETLSLVNNAKLEKVEELSEKILTVDSEEELINYIKH